MKIKIIPLIAIFFLLGACASQIMQGYVGKSVQYVVMDYGPPTNALDMPDGKRVFQWAINNSYTTPVRVNTDSKTMTNGTISKFGYQNKFDATSWTNSNTTIAGGETYNKRCVYSLFSTWSESQKTWVISGYKKPDLMCE